MSLVYTTLFGLDYETALLVTALVATLLTFLSMAAIVFFAWAPYVSSVWAREFGSQITESEDSDGGTSS